MKNKSILTLVLAILMLASIVLASCTGMQVATPTSTAPLVPTVTPKPAAIPIPTIAPIPLPSLTLEPGEFYFRLGDQPAMIFSRNFLGPILSRTGADLKTALEWAHQANTRLIRVHLTGWWGGDGNHFSVCHCWSKIKVDLIIRNLWSK